jgi:hypothetical protein
MLHGWWIAIVQNVAPKRFGSRQQRLHEEQQHRMLTASDIPTFAIAGTPAGDATIRVATPG